MLKNNPKIIKAIDTSIIKRAHVNKWVALSADQKKLLAVGNTLSDVINKTSDIKNKTVLMVLPNLGYVPTSF